MTNENTEVVGLFAPHFVQARHSLELAVGIRPVDESAYQIKPEPSLAADGSVVEYRFVRPHSIGYSHANIRINAEAFAEQLMQTQEGRKFLLQMQAAILRAVK